MKTKHKTNFKFYARCRLGYWVNYYNLISKLEYIKKVHKKSNPTGTRFRIDQSRIVSNRRANTNRRLYKSTDTFLKILISVFENFVFVLIKLVKINVNSYCLV